MAKHTRVSEGEGQEAGGAVSGEAASVAVRRVVRMLLTVLLLLFMAWLIDLQAALTLFRDAHWQWVVVCFVVIQIQVFLSALRWQRTAARLGQHLGVSRAVREYYLATLANLSLPGGVTGDAARIYRNRAMAGTLTAAQSVLIERVAGQIALLLVTLIAWLCWPLMMNSDVPVLGATLLLSVVVIFIGIALFGFLLVRLAGSRIAGFVLSLRPAVRRAWFSDGQWLFQGILSLVIVATYLLVFALCGLALQSPLPMAGVLAIVPLVLLSMVVPLSIGGWGFREAVAVSLWPLMGLTIEAAVATSVLYGLVSTLGSLPGALWAAWRSNQ